MKPTSDDTVFIGIPCYNRPNGLRRTIADIQAQTHNNWVAVISDNASPNGEVERVGRQAAASDTRISYIRQEHNIGAAANFRFLAESAGEPYFIWASDDDLREPELLATTLAILAEHPRHALAFTSIDNINRDDVVYRIYPGLAHLSSGESRLEDARNFIEDSEIMGKANIIYGLYRTAELQQAIGEFWDEAGLEEHGGDIVFVFGLICRHPIVGTDRVLLHKRTQSAKTSYRLKRPSRGYFVPLGKYRRYVERHVAVAPSPQFKAMVRERLRRRLIDKYLSRLGRMFRVG